ncbi:hypothetical protein G7Y89_g830 [Cudoniella acicularis]|uniref:Pyruvate decarboxylase n=1 Tax=Cudoniella acicularis TaxID=354080 RepID=A0A8H4W8I3_9HELO|nr:hypothetical protein G7Y89_g830 [Cudoniella acicularis]
MPVNIADYLFTRLHQIGIRSVHGVPGDFNLVALDYLPNAGLKWVGNVNELNAGYAADGYARVNGISAVMTTFGVGELSAINAIAGAYAENIPIIHIVGTPSTISKQEELLLHHSLGDGKFNVFSGMYKRISCAIGEIHDPYNAASVIDHTLRQCWLKSRPVYISLPTDMVQKKIEGEYLKVPIDLNHPDNDAAKEDHVVGVILRNLTAAKNPIILVDGFASRHRVLEEVHSLIDKTKLPVFVTPMGKGAVDETHENYGGLYAGVGSHPEVQGLVESSDLILTIGPIRCDLNTAGFSSKTCHLDAIDFHSTHVTVRDSEYLGIHMRGVLRKIIKQIDLSKSQTNTKLTPRRVRENRDSSSAITQDWFWSIVSRFLRDNDIVITDAGTANFGIWETKFPKGVNALSQVLWGSIGYSVGACQGAALAARDAGDDDRRTILFVGDGSFQLACQEVSTIIRLGLKPIIFVICNDGYTVERLIHGMDADYNDIQPWLFTEVIRTFGAAEGSYKTYKVKTKEEISTLFEDKVFNTCNILQLVELHMPKYDAPNALKMTFEEIARRNSRNK